MEMIKSFVSNDLVNQWCGSFSCYSFGICACLVLEKLKEMVPCHSSILLVTHSISSH